eukprot:5224970-Heterocapsa_arctica.AAC.1
MDWTMTNGRMLKLELQRDRVAPAVVAPQAEDICENMMRMFMQAETPAVRTCATARAIGTDITPDDLRGDCRSD